MSGRLVAFCGIDGSGKSTQLELLGRTLEGRGEAVCRTRQPSDFYRDLPEVRAYLDDGVDAMGMDGLALLAAADRRMHLRQVVAPAVARGEWVLSDRYLPSSIAFFGTRGVDPDFVRAINAGIPEPDLVVLCDVPAAAARERVVARDGPSLKFEERSLDLMEDVRRRFLEQVTPRWLVLDGCRPADEIHRDVLAALEQDLLS